MKRFKLKEEMALNAGGSGEYSTPRAARSKTSKDKNSPSGFESSPIPNMYSKSAKYKIVDKSARLNTVDLWKGQHLNEDNEPDQSNFPIKITSHEQAQVIGSWLKKHGFNLNLDDFPFSSKPLLIPIQLRANNKNIIWDTLDEIKVNNPQIEKIKQDLYKYWENEISKTQTQTVIQLYKDLIKDIKECNSEQEIDDVLLTVYSNPSFIKDRASKLNNPKEILHKTIKETQLKLDEVNRLIEHTSRVKGDLKEGKQEIEYLKRTKDSIYKIQERLREVLSKMSEIKVNDPTRPDLPIKVDKNNYLKIAIALEKDGYSWAMGKSLTKFNPFTDIQPHAEEHRNIKDYIILLDPKNNKKITWTNYNWLTDNQKIVFDETNKLIDDDMRQ